MQWQAQLDAAVKHATAGGFNQSEGGVTFSQAHSRPRKSYDPMPSLPSPTQPETPASDDAGLDDEALDAHLAEFQDIMERGGEEKMDIDDLDRRLDGMLGTL